MNDILEERQLTPYQQEMLELQSEVPDKFDSEFEFMVNKESSDRSKEIRYRSLSKGETAALVAASDCPTESSSIGEHNDYDKKYVPREFVENLMIAFFEEKEKSKLKKEQLEEEWKREQEQAQELISQKSKSKKKKTIKTKRLKSTKT